ncbi:MAG: threonine synthase [Sulfolobales archaeon]|nr:threonine synthase [Sulfolobales archaeon]
MADYVLRCKSCNKTYGKDFRYFKCSCGGVLEVLIDVHTVKLVFEDRGGGILRYRSLLPDLSGYVTLGEGRTPNISTSLSNLTLHFKLEYLNPTGSFKDRGSALAVSKAIDLGVNEVLEDSSGNTGISISAYAARAGIRARIYVPSDIPLGKYLLIKSFGAEVVKAGTRDEASRRVLNDLSDNNYYIGHTWNPYFIEGTKTFAYEIYEELGKVDYVITPVASGTLLLGIWKGFTELMDLGLVSSPPKLIGVQACGYDSLSKHLDNAIRPKCEGPTSLADAIRLTNAPRLPYMAEAIKKSGGFLVVVNDDEIINSLKELYRMGFAVEPTSAAAYAAFKLVKNELSGNVVIPLTGSGLKYLGGVESPLYKVFISGSA